MSTTRPLLRNSLWIISSNVITVVVEEAHTDALFSQKLEQSLVEIDLGEDFDFRNILHGYVSFALLRFKCETVVLAARTPSVKMYTGSAVLSPSENSRPAHQLITTTATETCFDLLWGSLSLDSFFRFQDESFQFNLRLLIERHVHLFFLFGDEYLSRGFHTSFFRAH